MLRHYTRTVCSGLLILVFATALFSQEPSPQPSKPKKGRLHVAVTSNENNQPIGGADVIVRCPQADFEETTRTDSQGIANIADVPYGNLIIQILMRGYKNWGGQVDFKTERPVSIKLEPEAKPQPTPKPTATPSR